MREEDACCDTRRTREHGPVVSSMRACFREGAHPMSDEAVREALTPDDALRRRMETALKIADAKMALGVACRGGHLRMTIPANPKHDHDLIIGEALRAAGELLDDLGIALAKANAELQGAQRADGYTESDPRLTRQLAAECVQLKVELAAAQREREASRQAALGALGSVANAQACGGWGAVGGRQPPADGCCMRRTT